MPRRLQLLAGKKKSHQGHFNGMHTWKHELPTSATARLHPLTSPHQHSNERRSGEKLRSSTKMRIGIHNDYGCVPFSESKNGFLILDLPDFSVERNVKSEIGFVTLVTFRQRVQYARQPLKK